MNQLNIFQSLPVAALTGRLLGRKLGAFIRPISDPHFSGKSTSNLTQALDIPIVEQSAEAEIRARLEARGQFLARQDRWEDLGAEIRQYDQSRATTPGGMPSANLLAIGARADVVRPVQAVLNDPGLMPHHAPRHGLSELELVLEDHPNNYGVALVVINAYVDIAWAWRGEGWCQDIAPSHWNKFLQYMQRAEALLDHFCPFEHNSPALAATRCALLAAQEREQSRVLDDYQDLIELDPKNPTHMRALGNHLLPRWFGDHQQLEVAARQVTALTEDIWGAGAYVWVYLDALTVDPEALKWVDAGLFGEGLQDILTRCEDQHTANMLAAFCALTLHQPAYKHAKYQSQTKALADNFDWIVHHHLREVHPLLWAQAELGPVAQKQKQPVEALIQRGKEKALNAVAPRFQQAIEAGQTVHFRPEGISTTQTKTA